MKNTVKKTILFILLEEFADWEAAFLASALRGGTLPGRAGRFETCYAAPGGRPVRSIGGLTVLPDRDFGSLPADCAGVILVGGLSWQSPAAEAVWPLVCEARACGLLVGAICNACAFLAAHGCLNDVLHTGNTVEMLSAWGGDRYTGAARYRERQAVADGGIVTANGSAALEFARACLSALGADTEEAIEAGYMFNKQGFYRE